MNRYFCTDEQEVARLGSQKDCNAELRVNSGSAGKIGGRMDIMLGWALVVLIIGCAVAYGVVRAAPASDRPAEPRRRRPF